MGQYLRAYNQGEAVFGRYNAFRSTSTHHKVSWKSEDPLFEIGNGSGAGPSKANNALTILKNAWTGIGIIGSNNDAKPTEMLDIGENPDENAAYEDLHKVKVRDLPRTEGNASDKIVTVDFDGVLRSIPMEDLNNNSSEKPQNTQLFSKEKNTSKRNITTTNNKEETFYLPTTIMPTKKAQLKEFMSYDINEKLFTIDLYQLYYKNFVGSKENTTASSPEAPETSNISKTKLHYYIFHFDDQIYQNVEINEKGILTYQVKKRIANPAKRTMNIGFKIKKQ